MEIAQNMLGMIDSEGAIAAWPEVDLNGQPYERANATRAQLDKAHFVVVPVNVRFDNEYRAQLAAVVSPLAPARESFSKLMKAKASDDNS